jgi:hypothetical protein
LRSSYWRHTARSSGRTAIFFFLKLTFFLFSWYMYRYPLENYPYQHDSVCPQHAVFVCRFYRPKWSGWNSWIC